MKENRIKIVFGNEFFDVDVSYQKAATFTVIDCFKHMCGFYADEFQIEENDRISTERYYSHAATVFLDSGEIPKGEYTTGKEVGEFDSPLRRFQKYHYFHFSNGLEETIKGIFGKVEQALPDAYGDVIEFFLQEKLWQIAILSQTCMGEWKIRKQVFDRCQKALEWTEGNNSIENHFIYTKMYLQYLRLDLQDGLVGQVADDRLYSLRMLFEESISMFKKNKEAIFVKLSAMIMGKMKNLDYAEKIYLSYINIISRDSNSQKEIGRTYYELGKLYDNFSKTSNYLLSTIHKAYEYYRLAYTSDPENYRAEYKFIIAPYSRKLTYDNMVRLELLHKKLQAYEQSEKGTLRVYLYQYKIMYYLLLYNLKKDKSIDTNQSYLDMLQQKHKEIEGIWKMLGLGDQKYPGAEKEIDRYLQVHIEEMADLILTLRKNGAASEKFQNKRYSYNNHDNTDKKVKRRSVLTS